MAAARHLREFHHGARKLLLFPEIRVHFPVHRPVHPRRRLARRRQGDGLPARIFAAIAGLALIGLTYSASSGVVDPRGEPVGTDFSNVWTASRLALSGLPASVYDMAAQRSLQQEVFVAGSGFYPFFYPPTHLLICWPLASSPI